MNAATLTSAIRESGSAKEIARAAGCSVATAARYRRGETLPDPLGLARLMGWSRAIANAMLCLAGLDDLSMDLETARLKQELRQIEARRADSAPSGRRGRSPDVETTDAPARDAPGTLANRQAKEDPVRERQIERAWDALRDADRRRR